ncbi:MAG: four helix bundle protein [Chitinophagaceae bacterium]
MQDYKKLRVWSKGHQFTLTIYKVAARFPREETFALTSQLKRASISVPANIAEGCGKNSTKDFANFLNISLGAANEAEYYLILAKDLNYMSVSEFEELNILINEIKGMLINLIQTVR